MERMEHFTEMGKEGGSGLLSDLTGSGGKGWARDSTENGVG